jgi:predicted alpha/beta-hydrolase family hydrolase
MPDAATTSGEAPTVELATPHGPARAHVHAVDRARAAFVLGHGANGSITAPDLELATRVATGAGVSVALFEQPYRVAGRRSPAPAHQLDAAWIAGVEALRGGPLRGLPLLVGGRSSGARVACRTAAATGATGVLCLAFPVHAPRRSPTAEVKTRQPELDAVTVPVLVIQGARDPFGMPTAPPNGKVVQVAGDHGLRADHAAIAAALGEWLEARLSAPPRRRRVSRRGG